MSKETMIKIGVVAAIIVVAAILGGISGKLLLDNLI